MPKSDNVVNSNTAALDIVSDLMKQLNADSVQDYGKKDSVAVNSIQSEMDNVVCMIETFVTKSLTLVDNEGK